MDKRLLEDEIGKIAPERQKLELRREVDRIRQQRNRAWRNAGYRALNCSLRVNDDVVQILSDSKLIQGNVDCDSTLSEGVTYLLNNLASMQLHDRTLLSGVFTGKWSSLSQCDNTNPESEGH